MLYINEEGEGNNRQAGFCMICTFLFQDDAISAEHHACIKIPWHDCTEMCDGIQVGLAFLGENNVL